MQAGKASRAAEVVDEPRTDHPVVDNGVPAGS